MTNLCHLPIDQATQFIADVFISIGVPSADAKTVANLMVQSDLAGADGHGIFRLPAYVKRIKAGGINLHPHIRIERERGGTALIDGDNGLGHLVMNQVVELATIKSREHGVCWIGSHHGNHSGAASVYVRMLAERGLIGIYMAVGNANHMAPWGGTDLLLSTNPIAIAVPTQKGQPIVLLDMATTVAAYGKVKLAAQRGESIPKGWMIDRAGKPILDPARSGEGSLLPIGDYKGYGLALMIGLLAGTLNGAAVGKETIDFNACHDGVTNTGQALIAVDPDAFGERALFLERVYTVVRDIQESNTLPDVDRIRIPGEGAHASIELRKRNGLPISSELLKALNACAVECGVPVLNL